jgi:hypothetical protein
MLRPLFAVAILLLVAAEPTLAAETAGVTRVETEPFYGAVVTVEHGVKVYRTLPVNRDVIIAPNNAPISLNYWRGPRDDQPIYAGRGENSRR